LKLAIRCVQLRFKKSSPRWRIVREKIDNRVFFYKKQYRDEDLEMKIENSKEFTSYRESLPRILRPK